MPFTSGVHIACTTITTRANATLTGDIVSSDTFPTGSGTSTPTASDNTATEIAAAVDVWVSYGAAPADPALPTTPRLVVRAGETRNLFLRSGFVVRVAAVA
ncbi:hypothetical protein [Methylorubrum suomiense]|uniref:Head decoration protein n=1 Tax=Methylorubrum suomiense TaxID=144191 RepID=A0ABQ4UZF7_9HYPH|nr:hypothetical protein [Methylorubrum suomiense]GJE77269.1 hypothetical protein BGCPKDLD_3872 [Methylorubrum suomiense]